MPENDRPPEEVAEAVLSTIASRRSVRRYRKDPVPDHLLLQVLEAANAAPSAHNKQAWRFVVLRDGAKEHLSRLLNEHSATLPRAMRILMRLASQIITSAPVVVAIFKTGELAGDLPGEGRPDIGEFFHLMEIQSASAAVQNLMLAATALGLGTVWLGAVCLLKEAIAAALAQDGELMAVVPIGYPAGPPGGPPRKKSLSEVLVDR